MAYGELPLIDSNHGQIPGLPILIQNPHKTAVLRLPDSLELLTYLSSQRSLYRDLGRRRGESEDVPNPRADRILFDACRLDKSGPEFDDAEILYALGLLTRHRVESCVRDGDNYLITLSSLFGSHTHLVRIPFQKEMMEYQRNVYRSRDLPHNLEERRFPPEVPVKLYDAIILSATGYSRELNVALSETKADDTNGSLVPKDAARIVPPHHKRAVITELSLTLSELDQSVADPNS